MLLRLALQLSGIICYTIIAELVLGCNMDPDIAELVLGCSMGPLVDSEIIRELFGNVIVAAEILGVDSDLRARLASTVQKLPPRMVSNKTGVLQVICAPNPMRTATHGSRVL